MASSKTALWAGYVMTGLVILFMAMDAVMKLIVFQPALEASKQLGWAPGSVQTLGVILLVCTVLYAIPRTAVLGAILLTGYLGGAVAAHLRLADPLFSHTLFGVYLGVLAWGGLWLRDARLQALFPFKRA